MKKILTTSILLSVLLFGCANSKSLEQQKFLFQSNQECLNLEDKILNDIKNRQYIKVDYFDNLTRCQKSKNCEWYLEEVFYSPKTNSCLFVLYEENRHVDTDDFVGFNKTLHEVGKENSKRMSSLENCHYFHDSERCLTICKSSFNATLEVGGEAVKGASDNFKKCLKQCTNEDCDEFDKKIEEYYKTF